MIIWPFAKRRVLLVSFPKCGSNWLRYCIEYFSGKSTPGSRRTLLHPDAPPAIDRTHFLNKPDRALFIQDLRGQAGVRPPKTMVRRALSDLKKRFQRYKVEQGRELLLLLRDPFELYVRVGANDPKAMQGYFTNILIFDRARHRKIVKYYEDMVADFDEVRDVLDFLGIENRQQLFDVEAHRRRSFELYKQGKDGPATEKDPFNFGYHSRELSPQVRNSIADMAISVLGPERADRYLARYGIGQLQS